MFRIKIILVFFLLAALNSCSLEDSGDLNQDKIWTAYEMVYDMNTNRSLAIASFRVESGIGEVVALNESASVLFNGVHLTYDDTYESYVVELSGYVDSGSFVYQDLDQVTFTNSILTIDTIALPSSFDTIHKNQTNTIIWDGISLTSNEEVSVYLEDWNWGDAPLSIQTSINSASIELNAEQVSELTIGQSTAFIERIKESGLEQGTHAGGTIKSRFIAEKQLIEIVN